MIVETEILKVPQPDAPGLSTLSAGSVVYLLGRKRGVYLMVEMESEEGFLRGWVNENALEKIKGDVSRPRKSKKFQVPQDEKLVIKRELSFFYGGQLGANISIINNDANPNIHVGAGFYGGAFIGLFASENIPIRFELAYSQLSGTSPDDKLNLSFGFLELAVVPSYRWNDFEVFAGLNYNLGIGINGDLPPPPIVLQGPGDLSSVAIQAGLGYHFPVGVQTDIVVRARYLFFFNNSPLFFQAFTLFFALEVSG